MKPSDVVELPVFIDVHDVMRSMKCSRTKAYDRMRAAIGRQRGQRGQLRVPVYVWLRYVQSQFEGAQREAPSKRRCPARDPAALIQITRPRTRPRGQVRGDDKN